VALAVGAPIAHADRVHAPWYEGPPGQARILHLSIVVGGAALYVLSNTAFTSLDPSSCRWCNPPGFDNAVRNALVWRDVHLADALSTIDAYALAPIVGLTFLYFSDEDASWSRLLDDTLPVMETVVLSQLFGQVVKVAVGRQRPYAHYGATPTEPTSQDNLSFFSGHSLLGFSITASAGLICHWRHYWTEPYVWGIGIALSLSTEYLRMAADKHYLSDVVTGGAVGLGVGLLVPRLMHHDIAVVPIRNGAAVVGMF
jgi:membrane-associated phospholipid phosphatase